MNLIEVKNLGKTYHIDEVKTEALKGASFIIKKGEFVAIMGPSGSGKSTLLHILGFLDVQTAGTYRFNGMTIRDYTEEEISYLRNQEMGFIFQMFNLLPKTTVIENVKLPLLYSNVKRSEWDRLALEAIKQVGLLKRINHRTNQLSGGEQQRVAIARALINNPKIIFADEPTGNIDSKSGRAIMKIMKDLNKVEKRTIIIITHESHVARYAKRIIRLKDGVIVSDRKIEKGHSLK